jgi:hypothetical protein
MKVIEMADKNNVKINYGFQVKDEEMMKMLDGELMKVYDVAEKLRTSVERSKIFPKGRSASDWDLSEVKSKINKTCSDLMNYTNGLLGAGDVDYPSIDNLTNAYKKLDEHNGASFVLSLKDYVTEINTGAKAVKKALEELVISRYEFDKINNKWRSCPNFYHLSCNVDSGKDYYAPADFGGIQYSDSIADINTLKVAIEEIYDSYVKHLSVQKTYLKAAIALKNATIKFKKKMKSGFIIEPTGEVDENKGDENEKI